MGLMAFQMQNLPVARVRLVAEPQVAEYLRRIYDIKDCTLVPPMRRGLPRRIREGLYAIPWNSSLVLAVAWAPQEMSLRQYSLNLKGLLYHLDKHNLKITIIWALTPNLSEAEKIYFKGHIRKFRRWIRIKKLLIDVLSPAQPIPLTKAASYTGNPTDIFGPRFLAEFNYHLPQVDGQNLPILHIARPLFTIPKEQSLQEFVSNAPA